jgi:ubiquinone biosynthesis protein UbiJ
MNEKLSGLFRRFTNAHFATCADEYREGVSDAAVERRYNASLAAEQEFVAAVDELQRKVKELEERIENLQ